MRIFTSYILIFILIAGCFKAKDLEDDPSVWPYAEPGAVGFSENGLHMVNDYISEANSQTRSLIIIKNDHLVFENYLNATDRKSNINIGKIGGAYIFSVFGEFVGSDLINLDTVIFPFLTDYTDVFEADPAKKTITLRNLLEMSSGLSWNETDVLPSDSLADIRMIQEANDPVRYLLERPLETTPGEKYSFNSAVSLLLMKIMEEISGRSIENIMNEELFEPVNALPEWSHLKDGTPNLVWGLSLNSLDFAKLNYLFLKEGDWFGEQVLDEDWIRECTSYHVFVNRTFSAGFYWTLLDGTNQATDDYGVQDIVWQYGEKSQGVYFSRENDLLITVLEDTETSDLNNRGFRVMTRVLDALNN